MNTKKQQPKVNSRRQFIKVAGAGLAALSFPQTFALAGGTIKSSATSPKIIWVLLRGALDSLHTVVPHSEPEYAKLRPTLSASFKAPLLPLSDKFSLHPALKTLYNWYENKEMLPVIAVSSGYQHRSHFDGQDFLESGLTTIDHDTGWLGRAINEKQKSALSVTPAKPISLRSSDNVNTWYPSNLKSANDDLFNSLAKLYQHDVELKSALEKGMEIRGIVGTQKNKKKRQGRFVDLAKACAQYMNEDPTIDCAMLELGGWDTHNQQANRLNRMLSELDGGLATLKLGLAAKWQDTTIIVATEFGRTAAENGTQGTDHGTASAMFMAGGAIDGGRVLGQWPGLGSKQLFEQRDLMPTSNTHSWIATAIGQHWQMDNTMLKRVFPNATPYNTSIIRKS